MDYNTAWYVQRESDGWHIVRDLPQRGPNAYEYHDKRTYRTSRAAFVALSQIKADLAYEDAMRVPSE